MKNDKYILPEPLSAKSRSVCHHTAETVHMSTQQHDWLLSAVVWLFAGRVSAAGILAGFVQCPFYNTSDRNMKLLKADCVCLLCHTYVVPVVHVHLKHSISWHVAQRPHLNSITRLNSECEHLWSCIPLSVENWLQCVKHDDPKCLCWTTLSQSLHMLMTEEYNTHIIVCVCE